MYFFLEGGLQELIALWASVVIEQAMEGYRERGESEWKEHNVSSVSKN